MASTVGDSMLPAGIANTGTPELTMRRFHVASRAGSVSIESKSLTMTIAERFCSSAGPPAAPQGSSASSDAAAKAAVSALIDGGAHDAALGLPPIGTTCTSNGVFAAWSVMVFARADSKADLAAALAKSLGAKSMYAS